MTLLWRRAIFDPGFQRIFCLAHAERLSYQVCDAALRSLFELSQGQSRTLASVKCVCVCVCVGGGGGGGGGGSKLKRVCLNVIIFEGYNVSFN